MRDPPVLLFLEQKLARPITENENRNHSEDTCHVSSILFVNIFKAQLKSAMRTDVVLRTLL